MHFLDSISIFAETTPKILVLYNLDQKALTPRNAYVLNKCTKLKVRLAAAAAMQ